MMRIVGARPPRPDLDAAGDLHRVGASRRRRDVARVALAAAACLTGRAAVAQVIEPNGVQVPSVNTYNNETSLQSYFTAQMEGIDAIKDAAIPSGVFEPLPSSSWLP